MSTVSTSERFSTITPNDHGGYVYIATLMAMTYSTLAFIARCLVKRRMFGVDDWAVVVAQTLFFGQFAAVLAALSAGLGKNFDLLDDGQFFKIFRSLFADQILLYLSLCVAKCSVVLLIQRLFTRDMKHFWLICSIFLGLVIAWGVASGLLVSIGCSPSSHSLGNVEPRCAGYLTRYKIISTLDVLTELLLVLVPVYLVSHIQMRTRLKFRVVLAFAFRLPVAAFSLLHLVALSRAIHASNSGVALARVTVYQQAQLGYSLISATIPCLKSFVKSFDTGLGLEVGYSTNPYGYGSSGAGGSGRGGAGESYKMSNMSKGSAGGSVSAGESKVKGSLKRTWKEGGVREITAKGPNAAQVGLRPEELKNTTNIYHSTTHEEDESHRSATGSEEMIIRREVQWDVRSDFVGGVKR
ncbi:uncharacterized protein BDZ99DRAFT_431394 [Mytilinidion resinicola]|uniref:Rhodopsin domain-containing protein n=1 Tax=Mytilinidion resinicola TaxID=574789 RepID=A0A6A6Z890_9PEZI|nr:uncharacterized protein BDZ99DRAFT_431394 [Mytilinidion resinicola]KAF2817342.1 hypothetical protein BDZ99DRAFT_431394 [Mytilinidion resinicola]